MNKSVAGTVPTVLVQQMTGRLEHMASDSGIHT